MATQTTGNKRPNVPQTSAKKGPSATTAAAPATAPVERDEVYGLVSVLYHALQGAETYGKYIEDARRGNDSELVEFFKESQAEENERAALAKKLLASRLASDMDDEDEDDEEDEDEEDEEEDED